MTPASPLTGPLRHASTPPGVAAPPGWTFPVPTSQHRLDTGLDVAWYRLPGQQVVALTLVLPLPLSREPRGLEGVATLTSRVLDEGTLHHPGEAFAERLEDCGAALGVHVALSGQQVMLDVPVTRFTEALPLLAEAVRAPQLDAADVARHAALRLAEIEQLEANSAQTANRWLRRALWHGDSRASRMNGGEPETVAAVDAAAVAAFHAEQFRPAGATLLIGGDLPADPIERVRAVFGDWVGTPVGAALPAPVPAAPTVRLIDRPGAVQADLRLGGPGIDRADPRWSSLLVAGTAVGGSFLSRLNRVLREERGYTYGVHLALTPHTERGSWSVSGSFRTDVVEATLTEMRTLLDLGAAPLTETETADAAQQLAGTMPLRAATAEGVVDQVASHLLAGLPAGDADRQLREIRTVAADGANAAYGELVDLSRASLVVVGDAEALEPALRAAGFAVTES